MKNTLHILCTTVALILFGCAEKPVEMKYETVTYDNTAQSFSDLNMIKDIQIIPIVSSGEMTALGMNTKLIETDDGYLLADPLGNKTVLHIDRSGAILNTIGRIGHGPQEYLSVDDIDVSDDNSVFVYGANNKTVDVFDLNGEYKTKEVLSYQFYKACAAGEHTWLHLGVNNQYFPERIVKIDRGGEMVAKALPVKANIMNNQELNSTFSKNGKKLYFREMFDRKIYEIDGDEVKPLCEFDFGQYAIPEQYYEMNNAMDAASFLFKQEFATLRNLVVNDQFVVVEAFIQKQQQPTLCYAVRNNKSDEWEWVNYTIPNDLNDLFAGRIKGFSKDEELLLLVEPEVFLQDAKYNSLYSNPEVVSKIDNNVLGVILKCRLK